MANIKISELNPLLTVEDADVLPIVDNAVTKKVTAAILRSYTQGNSVLLTGAQTVAGIKTFTSQLASSVATGTAPFSVASTTKVTNLNADLLDGLSSADFQATLGGTGIVKSTAGTISYLTDNSANWNTAFNDSITSAAVTGSGTNTLTLTQQDAGTITATWVNGTLIREIRNTTGATLTKGTIVYISGATGNKPTVTKAIATGDETSAQTFGFVQENILNNANGNVVVIGDLTGVDTSAFAEGAQLYLSSTVAGTFTDVKQYAPNHLVYVGIVTRAHPTLGQIEVNIQNGFEMDELHNVAAQNPSNGDILQYVTSTGLWTKIGGTTSAISEGTNLYFTDARSRNAISESVTGLDYNSTTGVLSTTSGYGIPTTASQTTWDTAYNDSIVSAAVTGTTTKTLTLNQQDGGTVTASWTDINTDAVSSVFGRTGAVVAASGDYTTTQVTEGTNLYYTEARVNANTNVAANTAARHNAVTLGTANGLSLSTQQLSLGLASGSTTGALSSTDWTTFNNKQNALTNPITGTGTTNYLPKFTGTSALGNSSIFDNGTSVGIGTATPNAFYKLDINGGVHISSGNFYRYSTDVGIIGSGTSITTGLSTQLGIRSSSDILFATNGANERMRITSAGLVAIGTTNNNGAKVVLKGENSAPPTTGTTTTAVLRLSSGTGLYNVLDFGTNETNDYSWIQSARANSLGTYDRLAIQPNGGSLLVGTLVNAGYKLDVNGTARVQGQLTIEANSSTLSGARNALYLKNTNASGNQSNIISLGSAGTATSWAILNDINADGTTINRLDFLNAVNGVQFSLTQDGGATFSGKVNIGNPVTAAVAVASTHKVEISIGGTTYYLLATT